jgi:hypothetical protein
LERGGIVIVISAVPFMTAGATNYRRAATRRREAVIITRSKSQQEKFAGKYRVEN